MADPFLFRCPECRGQFKLVSIEFEKVEVIAPPPKPVPTGKLSKMYAAMETWFWKIVNFSSPTVQKAGKFAFDMVCGGWNLADIPMAGCPAIILPFVNHTLHYLYMSGACLVVFMCFYGRSRLKGWFLTLCGWLLMGAFWLISSSYRVSTFLWLLCKRVWSYILEGWKWLLSWWPRVLLGWREAFPGQKPPDDQAGAPQGQSGAQSGQERKGKKRDVEMGVLPRGALGPGLPDDATGSASHDAILPEGAAPDHEDQLSISGLHALSTTPDIDPLQSESPLPSAILLDTENLPGDSNQTSTLPGYVTEGTGFTGLVDPSSTVQGVMLDSRSNLTERIGSDSLDPAPDLLQTLPVDFQSESGTPAYTASRRSPPSRIPRLIRARYVSTIAHEAPTSQSHPSLPTSYNSLIGGDTGASSGTTTLTHSSRPDIKPRKSQGAPVLFTVPTGSRVHFQLKRSKGRNPLDSTVNAHIAGPSQRGLYTSLA